MISEREEKFIEYWDQKRAMGKWRFAFIQGVLLWGIPVYAFIQLFYYFFRDEYVFETGRFLTGLIAWIIIGFFGFGLIMWWLNERAYRKIKIKNPEV